MLGFRAHAQQRFSTGTLPEPQFADPDRARQLATAFPEIEKLFNRWVEGRRFPGAVMGIVVDGELAWVKTAGVRDIESRAPVTPDTVFRIASMTKSFTALAILKLRDDGKLTLDDPVERYVPAFKALSYPTNDSPKITIRHLLTHSEGFPEDNAWGDRQLAQTDQTIDAWIRQGIPFSNAPGMAYEYSNYGFAVLGQVVQRVSGKPYDVNLREEILKPLGMNASTLEVAQVARDQIARGYGREGDALKPEELLAHGSFGAMGGLWTSARDLARYVGFMMSAFPPRDEAEKGPVKRSSLREMQQSSRWQGASALRTAVDAPLQLSASSYGYGLGVSSDCRFAFSVGHGGGLPGYGSLMRWLPEHGVGLIAMANLTYAGFGGLFNDSINALNRTGALKPRVVKPSPALIEAQKSVTQLILKWDDALATRIAADNLFMDEPAERRATRFRELSTKHGACRPAESPIELGNALRGSFRMPCERGWLNVSITLAPTSPARVQTLDVQSAFPPGAEMTTAIDSILRLMKSWDDTAADTIIARSADRERIRKHIVASSPWGACSIRDHLNGDGVRDNTVRFTCERGTLIALVSLDPESKKLKGLDLLPTRAERCVP
jgi:CubicO group peptidase (beta-lactamase class C family)